MKYADTQLAVLRTMALPGYGLRYVHSLRTKRFVWYTTDGKWVSNTTVKAFEKSGLIRIISKTDGFPYAAQITNLGRARIQVTK